MLYDPNADDKCRKMPQCFQEQSAAGDKCRKMPQCFQEQSVADDTSKCFCKREMVKIKTIFVHVFQSFFPGIFIFVKTTITNINIIQ